MNCTCELSCAWSMSASIWFACATCTVKPAKRRTDATTAAEIIACCFTVCIGETFSYRLFLKRFWARLMRAFISGMCFRGSLQVSERLDIGVQRKLVGVRSHRDLDVLPLFVLDYLFNRIVTEYRLEERAVDFKRLVCLPQRGRQLRDAELAPALWSHL